MAWKRKITGKTAVLGRSFKWIYVYIHIILFTHQRPYEKKTYFFG